MYARLDELTELVRRTTRRGRPAREDPLVRRRLARYEAIIAAMKYNGLRYLTRQLRGEPLSSETSVNKLHRAYLEIDMYDFAVELLGMAGLMPPGSGACVDGGLWTKGSLSWPNVVIGGGTPNIQKNIIAERLLGQPKD